MLYSYVWHCILSTDPYGGLNDADSLRIVDAIPSTPCSGYKAANGCLDPYGIIVVNLYACDHIIPEIAMYVRNYRYLRNVHSEGLRAAALSDGLHPR
jgi:hypothetical protein